jgi:hypothetical protein
MHIDEEVEKMAEDWFSGLETFLRCTRTECPHKIQVSDSMWEITYKNDLKV